jgi:hypothetical protein
MQFVRTAARFETTSVIRLSVHPAIQYAPYAPLTEIVGAREQITSATPIGKENVAIAHDGGVAQGCTNQTVDATVLMTALD